MSYIKCTYCGKAHLDTYKCKAKIKARNNQHKDSRYEKKYKPIYNSSQWDICKDIVYKKQKYCMRCKSLRGIEVYGEEVHHIVPLSVDVRKAYQLSNLICLCQKCHNHIHYNTKLKIDFNYDVDYWYKIFVTEYNKGLTVF